MNKTYFYLLSTVLAVFVSIAIFVIAYGGDDPERTGHTTTEIAAGTLQGDFSVNGTFNISTNMILGNKVLTNNGGTLLWGGTEVGTGAASAGSVPSGTIAAFYRTECPQGWVLADGTQGTPDLRGRMIIGNGTGTDENSLAQSFFYNETGGEYNHTLTSAQMPSHSHEQRGYQPGTGNTNLEFRTVSGTSAASGAGTEGAGSSLSHNIMSPYRALIYCMKEENGTEATSTATQCPSGFTKISNAGYELGCIQNDEANGGTGLDCWSAAAYCFDNFGGRLPSYSEIRIAFDNYPTELSDETNGNEWVDVSYFDSTGSCGQIATDGVSPTGQGASATVAFRCFIPSQGSSSGTGASPSFSVHKGGSSQSLPSGQNTKLTWSTEVFDTNNDFNLTNSSFMPTIAGKYLLTATTQIQISDGQDVSIKIHKNGVLHSHGNALTSPGADQYISPTVTAVVDATPGDYFDVYVYQDGGSRSANGAATHTYFTGSRIDGGNGYWEKDSNEYLTYDGNVDVNGTIITDGIGTTYLVNEVNNSATYLAGGRGTNQGANILLYGQVHATKPNVTEFRKGADLLMTIDNGGDVGIGTTTPSQKLHVEGNLNVTGSIYTSASSVYLGGKVLSNNAGTLEWGGTAANTDYCNGGTCAGNLRAASGSYIETTNGGNIWSNGNLYVTSDACDSDGSLGTCSSDLRLKENIVPITNAVDYLQQFKPVKFNFIGKQETLSGLIAQDVQTIDPALIIPIENNKDYITYKDPGFKFILIEAVKELKSENDAKQAEINLLKQELCNKDSSYSWC